MSIGLLRLMRAAWQEYERDYARYFAIAMIYYALVSLVPVLLLLLGGLGLLLRISDFAASAKKLLLETIETSFGPPLKETVAMSLQVLEQQSVIATLVSLIGLLLTGSALFHHLRMTFRAVWKYESPLVSPRIGKLILAALLEKTVAFVMMLTAGALLLVALMLIAALYWLETQFRGVPLLSHPVAVLLTLLGPFVIAPLTFALLFRFLPPIRLQWRDVWLASVLCAGAWAMGVELLMLYGSRVASDLGAYSVLGGVLLVMLWMNVVSQMLFLGAELCKITAARNETEG